MTYASLFTGIGGFDLAAEGCGWHNIFQVENEPFCIKVLKKNFRNVKRYGDIKKFNGKKYRGAIDVLSGGFPCQPVSIAGERKGNTDDRWLWPEMYRIIREIQPPYIVAENVPGLLTTEQDILFQQVCSDLENEGYEVQPVIIPSCAVGAPHRRDRIWIVAHSNDTRDRTSSSGIYRNGAQKGQERHNLFNKYFGRTEVERALGINLRKVDLFRAYRIKALGNAIVPQIAYKIFKIIKKLNNTRLINA